jgi:cytochrome c oxidase cbb3-type subunit I/II
MSMENPTAGTTTIVYDDKTPRRFMIASMVFAIVGMLAGVIAATQLSWWQMNGKFLEAITFGLFNGEGLQYITFGRLRPLHTNAAIFAFVGNMMFAGVYYSTQRLCKCRTASDLLSSIHFWGWQLIIVAAAISIPAGLTQGQEYAELIWPIDIAVALIWVVFAVNFFWTLAKRNEPSLYVALWFYIATIVTVAMLYIVNNLQLPTALLHGYPIFGGVQNALTQWWYGHNAVAFFLTTPILGIMYYFVPKAANRPVYSYRLSIIHFWSLVFIYIWAGPHHLLNTSLPHWLQLLGMLFSLMLWAPSWGGMLNGLLTLRGGWNQLRTDPVIKFFAAGVTFYGMSTFEGPLLSIRAVNQLSHYSDWTIGHVHSGVLGWNGFMAAGMFYWLAPRLWKTQLWSKAWANMHFWLGLIGILIYVAAMWVAGIMQGLMLGQVGETGTTLKYEFVETLQSINLYYILRTFGGLLFLVGFIMCAVNLFMTIRKKQPVDGTVETPVLARAGKDRMTWARTFINDPIAHIFIGLAFGILWFFLPPHADIAALVVCALLTIKGIHAFKKSGGSWANWHESLIENYLPFTVLVFIAVAIGGAVQLIPSLIVNRNENIEGRLQELYTPLELAGRDVYVAEGCYNCHSQMIRMLQPDVMRYGRVGEMADYSHMGESLYDHPFQWGSKRTGPDLAREGKSFNKEFAENPDFAPPLTRTGLRGNDWHYNHLLDPRQTSPGSNMPPYPWLLEPDPKEEFIKELPARMSSTPAIRRSPSPGQSSAPRPASRPPPTSTRTR